MHFQVYKKQINIGMQIRVPSPHPPPRGVIFYFRGPFVAPLNININLLENTPKHMQNPEISGVFLYLEYHFIN